MKTWKEIYPINQEEIKREFRSFLRESGPKEYNLDKIIEEDEIIREMAIAGYGDWKPSREMIASMSTFILDKNWTFINELNINSTVYRIYKQKNVYIAGYFNENEHSETKFEVDFEIKLTENKSTAIDFKITKQLMNVDGVRVQETARGYGIATAMYKFLVKHENYCLYFKNIHHLKHFL